MIDRITSRITNTIVIVFLSALAFLGLLTSGIAHIQGGDVNWWSWADRAFQNFSTEIIGAVLTFILIEVLVGKRQKREGLIEQLRAGDASALGRLHENNIDLSSISLLQVNWQNKDFSKTVLQGAYLQGANLRGTNLQGAFLRETFLQGAFLNQVNLQWANLEGAVLDSVNLDGAFLQGTYLQGAILAGASLQGAVLDKMTILPDGKKWTPDTDMARFTDSEHPDFWQPE